jgi:hypothetical protein
MIRRKTEVYDAVLFTEGQLDREASRPGNDSFPSAAGS